MSDFPPFAPTSTQYDFSQLAYANGAPLLQGVMRSEPDDFQVVELNSFTLSGEGEHLWCWVEKRGENSDWVAKELAKWAGISRRNVGVAGQKDRHAVTQQWFSLHLPGQADPDLAQWMHDSVKILRTVRHNRKLQTGGLSGNRFILRLRNLSAEQEPMSVLIDLQRRLNRIAQQGIPNYFGPQRFGHNGNNLSKGLKELQENRRLPKHKRSLYLSALRSWPFNLWLSWRVQNDVWKKLFTGDVLNLQGSSKWFVEDGSEGLQQRIDEGDLHITGPMIGEGECQSSAEVKVLESLVGSSFEDFLQVLVNQRVKVDRRPLSLLPLNLIGQFIECEAQTPSYQELVKIHTESKNNSQTYPHSNPLQQLDLMLSFDLPAGSYATMVLRELIDYREPDFRTGAATQ